MLFDFLAYYNDGTPYARTCKIRLYIDDLYIDFEYVFIKALRSAFQLRETGEELTRIDYLGEKLIDM